MDTANLDSVYIAHYSRSSLTGGAPILVSKLYAAHVFIRVEDHAFENCPEGYSLTAIEKYFNPGGLFGEINYDLRAETRVSNA